MPSLEERLSHSQSCTGGVATCEYYAEDPLSRTRLRAFSKARVLSDQRETRKPELEV